MIQKIGFFLLLCGLLPVMKASDISQRECPEGYFYAGEDSPYSKILGYSDRNNIFYEEISRSDVYSCYKIIDFNTKDAQGVDYFKALDTCANEENYVHNKARLLSFEDGYNEMQRLAWKTFEVSKPWNHTILTSGLRLPSYNNYVWGSTNQIYNISEIYIKIEGKDDPERPCLALRMESPYKFSLEAVSCKGNIAMAYVCEVRVQMVTFYMWFSTNSWNLILLFTILVLGIALCMSGFTYKSTPRMPPRGRAAGMNSSTTNTQSKADLPPSYETYVNAQRIHEGLPPKYDTNREQISRMNHLKNKGKEILATVTVMK